MRTDSWWQIINIRNNLPFVTPGTQITSSVLMSLAWWRWGSTCPPAHRSYGPWSFCFGRWGGIVAITFLPWVGLGFITITCFLKPERWHHQISKTSGWSPWSKSSLKVAPLSLCLRLLYRLAIYWCLPGVSLLFIPAVLIVLSDSVNPATQPATLWEIEVWGFILQLKHVNMRQIKILCHTEASSFLYKTSLL